MGDAGDDPADSPSISPPEGPSAPAGVLRAWLNLHPDAPVSALGPDGQPVPMPAGIPLLPSHRVDDRSFVPLVAPEEATRLVTTFNEVLQHGLAVVTVRMADGTAPVTLHYADVRNDYGVVLRVALVEGDYEQIPAHTDLISPSRPRLAVIEKDNVSAIRDIDEATTLLLGWTAEEMVGRPTLDFIHPDDQARAIDNWMAMVARGDRHAVRLRYRSKDGSWRWLETSNEFANDRSGERYVTCQMIDISDEMAAVEALRHSEEFLRRMAETVPVGLAELAPDRTVRYANDALKGLWSEHKLDSFEAMVDALGRDDRIALNAALDDALEAGLDGDIDLRLLGIGSTPDRLCRVGLRAVTTDGEVIGVLACLIDVTDLKTQAVTDPLTGVHNRTSIFQVLRTALSGPDAVGVIFLDLDRFKQVNDRAGHDYGDQILAGAAAVLLGGLREGDAVGRIGGDEFLVVCPRVDSEAVLTEVARRLQQAVRSHAAESPDFDWGMSAGVVWLEPGDVSAEEAVSRADTAMYVAKRRPGGDPVAWRGPDGAEGTGPVTDR